MLHFFLILAAAVSAHSVTDMTDCETRVVTPTQPTDLSNYARYRRSGAVMRALHGDTTNDRRAWRIDTHVYAYCNGTFAKDACARPRREGGISADADADVIPVFVQHAFTVMQTDNAGRDFRQIYESPRCTACDEIYMDLVVLDSGALLISVANASSDPRSDSHTVLRLSPNSTVDRLRFGGLVTGMRMRAGLVYAVGLSSGREFGWIYDDARGSVSPLVTARSAASATGPLDKAVHLDVLIGGRDNATMCVLARGNRTRAGCQCVIAVACTRDPSGPDSVDFTAHDSVCFCDLGGFSGGAGGIWKSYDGAFVYRAWLAADGTLAIAREPGCYFKSRDGGRTFERVGCEPAPAPALDLDLDLEPEPRSRPWMRSVADWFGAVFGRVG